MTRFLISGTKSGLGKKLHQRFGGMSWTRETSLNQIDPKHFRTNVIIHCAFNSKPPTPENLSSYIDDNYGLTKKLLEVIHDKFIFISTIDVYSKDEQLHQEDEVLDMRQPREIYPWTKLASEVAVTKKSNNFLILRCSALLGQYSRPNSLTRILDNDRSGLSLAPTSMFNYVLHSDISDFIKLAIDQDLTGIFNIMSSRNIVLSEVAKLSKRQVNYGEYVYNCGQIDNAKVVSVFPAFNKTSAEVIKEFISQRNIKNQNRTTSLQTH